MTKGKFNNPVIHLYSRVGTPQFVFFIAVFSLLVLPILTIEKYSLIDSLFQTFYLGSLYYLVKSQGTGFFRITTIILLIAIIDVWTSFFGIKFNSYGDYLLPVLLMILSFVFVIRSVVHSKGVDLNVVLSAITGYILIGFLFGILIYIMELLQPGNFSVEKISYYNAEYFSFVTMSTLGYGDIVPITESGRAITIITTLAGQFYMVIVMGIIVGKFISDRNK